MITDIRNLIAARRDEENDEGGFTLIELLIVIVVLGILAAIVVFAVQNVAGDSAKSSCKTDAKTIEVAQEAHKAKTGVYANGIVAPAAPAAGTSYLVPNYLKSAPGNAPRYTITTDTNGIVLVQSNTMASAATPVAPNDHNVVIPTTTTKPCDTVT